MPSKIFVSDPEVRTTDGSATPDSLDGQSDHRGFTGHEMLDQLDLVHMNGRVYDPQLGKFLSADPLIQDPVNGQSYNRYAYVFNNPTNLTDPTGFASMEHDKQQQETWSQARFLYGSKASSATQPSTAEEEPAHAMEQDGTHRGFEFRRTNKSVDRQVGEAGAATKQAFKQMLINIGESPVGDLFGAAAVAGVVAKGGSVLEASWAWIKTRPDKIAGLFGKAVEALKSLKAVAAEERALERAAKGFGPVVGGGAKLENLTSAEIARIQNAANRTGTEISVVGSRANGTARANSDWDYVIPEGTSRSTRHSLSSSVPEGPRGLGEPRNQDFFREALDPNRPHITFIPVPR